MGILKVKKKRNFDLKVKSYRHEYYKSLIPFGYFTRSGYVKYFKSAFLKSGT